MIIFCISKYGFLRVLFGNIEEIRYIRIRIFILFISIIMSMIQDYNNFSYTSINIIKNIFFSIFLLATIKSIEFMINDAKTNKKKF